MYLYSSLLITIQKINVQSLFTMKLQVKTNIRLTLRHNIISIAHKNFFFAKTSTLIFLSSIMLNTLDKMKILMNLLNL